jgi:hypothetical protein
MYVLKRSGLMVFNMQTVVLYVSIQRGLGGRHVHCAK